MSKHTPTPWKASSGFIVAPGFGWKGMIVAQAKAQALDTYTHCTLTAEANARFIVKACNAHDDLVDALKEVIRLYGAEIEDSEFAVAAWRVASAAIAKLEGEK